jgi:DNA-binding transcriptional LysR family regulator
MQAEPGWELYRTFLAVMREGSLASAARALGIAQPTVGRHIDALEGALGVALFTRSPLGLNPTEAAATVVPYAQSLEATAAALLRATSQSGKEISGTVRVTASEVVAVEVLPPIVAGLIRRYPRLSIELVATNRVEDLLQREADIAVRMLRPTQQALVVQRVADIDLGLHAHRDYLGSGPLPRKWSDLNGHAFIGFDRENSSAGKIAEALAGVKGKRWALRCDNHLAYLAAIRAGVGIGVSQVPLARRDPALVHILPKLLAPKLETWITMHEDLRASPRCRATFDALVAGLEGYVRETASSAAGRTTARSPPR